METNISIIISSNSSKNENNKFKNHILSTIGVKNIEILIYENFNEFSLTEIYNRGLNESKNEICVFIHNDIEFLDKNWGNKLIKHFKTSDFGILGVAGSTELGKDGIWWNRKDNLAGSVTHLHDNKKVLSKYSNNFGNLITETLIVDGLFIAVEKNRLKSEFNEFFNGFHFYDLSFCLDNYMLNVKIGVIHNISILHKSIGKLSNDFFIKKSKFLKFYDYSLPKRSKVTLNVDNNKSLNLKNKPKTSIIIPHINNNVILFNLLKSLYKNDLNNIDIIIADTGSELDNLNELKLFIKDKINIILVEYDYYNYSKINNDVVKNHVSHETEVLIFCNNDIELINDTINILISEYQKNKNTIGTIGARLHFPNNSVQHSGVICVNKSFTHLNYKSDYTYVNNIKNDVLGNTAALLLTPKKLFLEIGGFNEEYNECYEDVEYNLQCILKNKKNIFCGYAIAYHHESLTRNNSIEKIENESKDYYKLLDFFNTNISRLNKYVLNVNYL